MKPAITLSRRAYNTLCLSHPPLPPNFAPSLFTISPGYYSRPAFVFRIRIAHNTPCLPPPPHPPVTLPFSTTVVSNFSRVLQREVCIKRNLKRPILAQEKT